MPNLPHEVPGFTTLPRQSIAAATTGKAPAVTGGDVILAALRQGKPTVAEFGSTKCVGCRMAPDMTCHFVRVL